MDKQQLNKDALQHFSDGDKQHQGQIGSADPVPNLPDECGDSLWNPVLAQEEIEAQQIKGANSDQKTDTDSTSHP